MDYNTLEPTPESGLRTLLFSSADRLHDLLMSGGRIPQIAEEQCRISIYEAVGWNYAVSEQRVAMTKFPRETTLVAKAFFVPAADEFRKVDFHGEILAPDGTLVKNIYQPSPCAATISQFLVEIFESYIGGHTNVAEALDIAAKYRRDSYTFPVRSWRTENVILL